MSFSRKPAAARTARRALLVTAGTAGALAVIGPAAIAASASTPPSVTGGAVMAYANSDGALVGQQQLASVAPGTSPAISYNVAGGGFVAYFQSAPGRLGNLIVPPGPRRAFRDRRPHRPGYVPVSSGPLPTPPA
jgi:hypothetical protein